MLPDKQPYVHPEIDDLGTLVELTAGCVGPDNLDESMKSAPGFESVSPAFGDPSFCTP